MTNTPKTLGNSTLEVGRIGLGCMGMSEFYGGTRDEAAHIERDRRSALLTASTESLYCGTKPRFAR